MEEKLIEKKQDQTVVKKVYTPPTLTVYGKLTELTAGGSGTDVEVNPGQGEPKKRP